MSRENVEIVRSFNAPYEGQNVIPRVREITERLGSQPDVDEVLAVWAEDPSWRHAHPELQWDASAVGMPGSALNGPGDIVAWWADWVEVWQSYSYRIAEYRDLGEFVLSTADVEAIGPGDLPLAMRVFQIWTVRDGKVASCRHYASEEDAIAAMSR